MTKASVSVQGLSVMESHPQLGDLVGLTVGHDSLTLQASNTNWSGLIELLRSTEPPENGEERAREERARERAPERATDERT